MFGLGGAFLLPVALPLLGFTSGGVAAGSAAASIQSVFYGGAAGGLFATAQERFHRQISIKEKSYLNWKDRLNLS